MNQDPRQGPWAAPIGWPRLSGGNLLDLRVRPLAGPSDARSGVAQETIAEFLDSLATLGSPPCGGGSGSSRRSVECPSAAPTPTSPSRPSTSRRSSSAEISARTRTSRHSSTAPPAATLTHRELYEQVPRIAAALAQRGIGRGDVVALYAPNSPAWAAVFHGVLRANATVTSVHALYTAGELAAQLADPRPGWSSPPRPRNRRAARSRIDRTGPRGDAVPGHPLGEPTISSPRRRPSVRSRIAASDRSRACGGRRPSRCSIDENRRRRATAPQKPPWSPVARSTTRWAEVRAGGGRSPCGAVHAVPDPVGPLDDADRTGSRPPAGGTTRILDGRSGRRNRVLGTPGGPPLARGDGPPGGTTRSPPAASPRPLPSPQSRTGGAPCARSVSRTTTGGAHDRRPCPALRGRARARRRLPDHRRRPRTELPRRASCTGSATTPRGAAAARGRCSPSWRACSTPTRPRSSRRPTRGTRCRTPCCRCCAGTTPTSSPRSRARRRAGRPPPPTCSRRATRATSRSSSTSTRTG